MKNNKNTLGASKALKLYNGNNILKLSIYFSGFTIICYFSLITIFVLFMGIRIGFDNAYAEICGTLFGNLFFVIFGVMVIALHANMTYEKHLPGGKFFRSIKGGFKTYKKMKTGYLISTTFVVLIYCGVICAINVLFPIMLYGTTTCIATVICLLLGISFENFIGMIKNYQLKSLLEFILVFALCFSVILAVYATEGRLGMIYITAAVIAVVLLPISHKLMLNNYQKERWDR